MKNDGTYFQITPIGKYYPDEITKYKWKGIEFFVSPALINEPGNVDIKNICQDPFIFIVTHKETGYSIGGKGNNSTTIAEAKMCAEVVLDKTGEDRFGEVVKKVLEMQNIKFKDSEC
jgi:hypothetical protein